MLVGDHISFTINGTRIARDGVLVIDGHNASAALASHIDSSIGEEGEVGAGAARLKSTGRFALTIGCRRIYNKPARIKITLPSSLPSRKENMTLPS